MPSEPVAEWCGGERGPYCPQNHGHYILQKQEAESPFPGLDPSWSNIDFAVALVSVSVFQRVLLV